MKNFPVFLTYIILEQPNRGGGSLLWPFPADPGVQELKGIYDFVIQFSENWIQICTMDTKQSQTSIIVINSFGPCTTDLVKADP